MTIGINQIFWVYESLFNELDRLSTIVEQRVNAHHTCLTALAPALWSLNAKLQKYYNKTAKVCVHCVSQRRHLPTTWKAIAIQNIQLGRE